MYKPTYVWPNPAFPFRVYFECEKLRIFIIENIQHNWEWLSKYSGGISKERDFFFVYCGWFHSKHFAIEASKIFNELGLERSRFYFLFNSKSEMDIFTEFGFLGGLINQNCWLDENLVMKPLQTSKLYDAIYVARLSTFKRHHLAKNVGNLALVAGNNHGNVTENSIPDYTYLNEKPLKPEEVCLKINQAKCGLILSAEEGACFASSEYLLCGLPVVSTEENGGRSVWYDSYNSIICEADPKEIARAVEFFNKNDRDPAKIRGRHISLANIFRAKFIVKFAETLHAHGVVGIDVIKYFERNFIHKLRKSQKPDFDKIFGSQDV